MLSIKSVEVIVSCGFKETFIKAVTRSQLISAARTLLPKDEAKELRTVDKQKLLVPWPLALAFLKKKIVGVKKGSKVNNLTQNCVKLIGNF